MKCGFSNKRAFTLIELLVVVAILGILTLLAAPRFLEYIETAKLTHIKHDIKILEGVLSEYLIINKSLPPVWKQITNDNISNQLYSVDGEIEMLPEGTYKKIDEDFIKKEINTSLNGTFYSDQNATVYYEDGNSLGSIEDNLESNDNLFVREIHDQDIRQDKIEIVNYSFPNGIYKNGENVFGNIEIKGLQSGTYQIEFYLQHSKFKTLFDTYVDFDLQANEIRIIDFSQLVNENYIRGFYNVMMTVSETNNGKREVLADYYIENSVYIAEDEWVYYYDDDFEFVERPVAGIIGSIDKDMVSYEYVEVGSIDYSRFKFSTDGNKSGQIRSLLPATYGTYEARMKVPDSDALLNGFFLYGDDRNYEIDMEILFYEGRWQVWGTVFNENHEDYIYNGVEPGVIYQTKIDLDFDPSKDYHSYRIDFYENFISFSVDGYEFGRWENKFNYGEMNLFAGNFYTHWLSEEISDQSLEMDVEWIRKGFLH